MTATISRGRKSTPKILWNYYDFYHKSNNFLGKTLSALVLALESGQRIIICQDLPHPHWTNQALKAQQAGLATTLIFLSTGYSESSTGPGLCERSWITSFCAFFLRFVTMTFTGFFCHLLSYSTKSTE